MIFTKLMMAYRV